MIIVSDYRPWIFTLGAFFEFLLALISSFGAGKAYAEDNPAQVVAWVLTSFVCGAFLTAIITLWVRDRDIELERRRLADDGNQSKRTLCELR